jgi:hypothetical protein
MKKTYKTRYTGYGIYVNINGESKLVRFEKKLVPSTTVGSTFVTDDFEMQLALEAHRDYGMEFWTDDKEIVEVKEEAQDEPKKVKRYKTKE